MLLAKRIRKIREAKDLTQEYVANLCNISQSAYSQMERKAGSCSFHTLEKVAQALGVSVPFLVDVENPEFIEKKDKKEVSF